MSMVQLIVPVMMQQDQLIVCKAPVDWMKASVIHENTAHVLSLNYNPVFLPVDRADISTGWNCKEVTHKADGHPTTYSNHCHQDYCPLLPPMPPKPTHIYCYGVLPPATTPMKCSRTEQKIPGGTVGNRA